MERAFEMAAREEDARIAAAQSGVKLGPDQFQELREQPLQGAPQVEQQHTSHEPLEQADTANARLREQEIWSDESRARLAEQLSAEEQLAADELMARIEDDRRIESDGGQIDADPLLADIAGELLEKVRHEQDEKFKQSEFMSLMMRIRDGAATIRHGQMVDGNEETAARIPPNEQDHDSSRDTRMTGALPPSDGPGESPSHLSATS